MNSQIILPAKKLTNSERQARDGGRHSEERCIFEAQTTAPEGLHAIICLMQIGTLWWNGVATTFINDKKHPNDKSSSKRQIVCVATVNPFDHKQYVNEADKRQLRSKVSLMQTNNCIRFFPKPVGNAASRYFPEPVKKLLLFVPILMRYIKFRKTLKCFLESGIETNNFIIYRVYHLSHFPARAKCPNDTFGLWFIAEA